MNPNKHVYSIEDTDSPALERLSFALGSEVLDFAPDDEDDELLAVAEIGGNELPVTIRAFDEDGLRGQVHLEMRLAQEVPGKKAFGLYQALVGDPEAFCMWVDPRDGEVEICRELEGEDAEEVDRVAREMIALAERYQGVLNEFQDAAERQSNEDKFAYDVVSNIMLRRRLKAMLDAAEG